MFVAVFGRSCCWCVLLLGDLDSLPLLWCAWHVWPLSWGGLHE